MIRPVGINDAQLRNRRGTVLRVTEILLHEREVFLAHRKTVLSVELFELPPRELVELRENLHVHRQHNAALQCGRRCKRCLTTFHRIDEICFDLLKHTIINFPDQNNDTRRPHIGTLSLCHELHALGRCCRRRIKLPRQRLNRKHLRIGKKR